MLLFALFTKDRHVPISESRALELCRRQRELVEAETETPVPEEVVAWPSFTYSW